MSKIMRRLLLSSVLLVTVAVHGQEIVSGESCKNAKVKIESVTERYSLSEGPHWDQRSQKLYFVDIIAKKLCRLDPETGSVTCTVIDNGYVGVAIPVDDEPNTFVAGAGTDFVLVNWNSDHNTTKATTRVLTTVYTDRENTRWNDGKADSSGRFWGGTMGMEAKGGVAPNQGSLYRIDSNAVPRKEISPVTISNGIAWSLEDDVMFYIDSPTRQIVAYTYDAQNGNISDKRVVFDLAKNDIPGVPDGMTIDTDGNLWVAVYGGSRVLQVDPRSGKLRCTVNIPAKNVTSVAFGGPLLDTLFVTTSSYNVSEEELKEQPKAGSLFAIKGLGVRGLAPNNYKLSKKL